ncbi:hypothetical protein B0T24DRAFT_600112 [Lasiosphaeria ovina]|uniref:Uncharacterized protein n=1 Tax=Lasiosphaeria ovina TaxID=92902 RepID=A0AAE0JS26_9PEZI|nr:hypothetical protein B0T24DRAFT_600112 [Lasiosphaeria ovina]
MARRQSTRDDLFEVRKLARIILVEPREGFGWKDTREALERIFLPTSLAPEDMAEAAAAGVAAIDDAMGRALSSCDTPRKRQDTVQNMLIQQVPHSHPVQDCVVAFLTQLTLRDRGVVSTWSGHERLWAELPQLRSSLKKDEAKSAAYEAEYVNLRAFIARMARAGIMGPATVELAENDINNALVEAETLEEWHLKVVNVYVQIMGGELTYERIHGPASYDYQSRWAKEYAEKFGKAPYLPPAIKNRWPYVTTITPENVAGAWKQVDAYNKWFQSKYLSADPETSSTAVMVDRWTWKLNYRDTLKETPNAGRDYGFGQEFSSSFAELLELVICIGQYEYHSEISQTIEYAPVAVSLTGAKGSDQMLLKLAEEFLAFAGIPATVLAGKTPFSAKEHRLPPDWKL